MKRSYFISFMNKRDGMLRCSHRVLNFPKGIFSIKEVVEYLEKEYGITEIAIIFFKELKKYEMELYK